MTLIATTTFKWQGYYLLQEAQQKWEILNLTLILNQEDSNKYLLVKSQDKNRPTSKMIETEAKKYLKHFNQKWPR